MCSESGKQINISHRIDITHGFRQIVRARRWQGQDHIMIKMRASVILPSRKGDSRTWLKTLKYLDGCTRKNRANGQKTLEGLGILDDAKKVGCFS